MRKLQLYSVVIASGAIRALTCAGMLCGAIVCAMGEELQSGYWRGKVVVDENGRFVSCTIESSNPKSALHGIDSKITITAYYNQLIEVAFHKTFRFCANGKTPKMWSPRADCTDIDPGFEPRVIAKLLKGDDLENSTIILEERFKGYESLTGGVSIRLNKDDLLLSKLAEADFIRFYTVWLDDSYSNAYVSLRHPAKPWFTPPETDASRGLLKVLNCVKEHTEPGSLKSPE